MKTEWITLDQRWRDKRPTICCCIEVNFTLWQVRYSYPDGGIVIRQIVMWDDRTFGWKESLDNPIVHPFSILVNREMQREYDLYISNKVGAILLEDNDGQRTTENK